MSISDSLTLKEGLKEYFRQSGFDEKTYTDNWVRIPLIGPITFYFPNWPERKRVVRFHDLHHVLTEYPTTLLGEGLIGAWELGSGCMHHPAALILNSLSLPLGFLQSPKRIFQAFVRGRNCRNLYNGSDYANLLEQNIRQMRENLNLSKPLHVPRTSDFLTFLNYLCFGAFESLILIALTLSPILLLYYFF